MKLRHRAILPGAIAGSVALLLPAAAGADPRLDYMLHCRGCHLEDGSGAPGIVPDFRGSVARFLAVPGGRSYLIRVPGSAQSALPDERLAEVLNFIVRRFGPRELAEAAPPFTAEEVAASRRPLPEVGPVRERLLRAIGARDAGGGTAGPASPPRDPPGPAPGVRSPTASPRRPPRP